VAPRRVPSPDDPRRLVRLALRAPSCSLAPRARLRVRARHALGVRRFRRDVEGEPPRPDPLSEPRRWRCAYRLGSAPRLARSQGRARAGTPPAGGVERRIAAQRIALAPGAIDKVGAAAYERRIRPSMYRWPQWIERCCTQGLGAIAALATMPWPEAPLDQAQITTACMSQYVQIVDPELLPPGRHPTLDALAARCEARPEFQATRPAEYQVPRGSRRAGLPGSGSPVVPPGSPYHGRQVLKSTLTWWLEEVATTRSGVPSPFRSAAATARGPAPAVYRAAAANRPLP